MMNLLEEPWAQGEISPLPVVTVSMNMHDEYIRLEDTKLTCQGNVLCGGRPCFGSPCELSRCSVYTFAEG